ncbi:MAG: AraC family ligand binding domain-containing protein [Lachnospiraceae bacterium]|nr:AraC family ligand binding domain-containing protein [Lachnospiraceae bacterium]
MEYSFGNYGFLPREKMQNQPLFLLDFGVERRDTSSYFFENKTRASYQGYLFQYTLNGCGVYEDSHGSHLLSPGQAFFAKMPEDSRYYYPASHSKTAWDFFYLHFDGFAADSFYDTIRGTVRSRHLPSHRSYLRPPILSSL